MLTQMTKKTKNQVDTSSKVKETVDNPSNITVETDVIENLKENILEIRQIDPTVKPSFMLCTIKGFGFKNISYSLPYYSIKNTFHTEGEVGFKTDDGTIIPTNKARLVKTFVESKIAIKMELEEIEKDFNIFKGEREDFNEGVISYSCSNMIFTTEFLKELGNNERKYSPNPHKEAIKIVNKQKVDSNIVFLCPVETYIMTTDKNDPMAHRMFTMRKIVEDDSEVGNHVISFEEAKKIMQEDEIVKLVNTFTCGDLTKFNKLP